MTLAGELLGWAGAGCLLVAYALFSARWLGGSAYQLLNLAGSCGLAVNAAEHHAWPSTTLNLLWAGVGAVALTRIGRPRSRLSRR